MADNERKAKPKNLLNSPKFKLTTKNPVKDAKQRPELSFYAGGDNPGITVYTRAPGDESNNFGRIVAKMGISDFQALLMCLEGIIDAEPGNYMTMTCDVQYDAKGNKLERKQAGTAVHVGKRKDGVIYIALEDLMTQGRPKIAFPFAPTWYHHLSKNGSDPLSEAETSVYYAKAFARSISQLANQIGADTYEHVDRSANFRKGGGGGYSGGNRGNYNNNRNNQSSDDGSRSAPSAGFDDDSDDSDIPF